MKHRTASTGAHQIEDHVHAINQELQHLEFALLRLRKFTQLMLSANASSMADMGPLEQMYEDLERAIRPPGPPERAPRTAPVPQDSVHAQQQQEVRRVRPRAALLPSRIHEPADRPLQIVQAPLRSGAASSAGR